MTDGHNGSEHTGLRVERDEFIASMAAFPTGVTIVTTLDEDSAAVGLTCNAFMSVSAEPPLVLVAVDKTSNTLPALRRNGRFVVNFLAAGREALALLGATKRTDKFVEIPWRGSDHFGLPILHEDTIAHASCDVVREIEAGDHVLLLGRVHDVSPPEPTAVPLLYFKRTYDQWPLTS
jgi:flavin reductase (DIM6/NTAB) family NADH-FMN oxidoreductase RutF